MHTIIVTSLSSITHGSNDFDNRNLTITFVIMQGAEAIAPEEVKLLDLTMDKEIKAVAPKVVKDKVSSTRTANHHMLRS